MKTTMITSGCGALAGLLVACSSSSPPDEATSKSRDALIGQRGCTTVGISPGGSATTNAGAVYTSPTWRQCVTPPIQLTSSSSYPGTPTCTDDVILELDGLSATTGYPWLSVDIVSPPTQETDCELTQLQVDVWGFDGTSWQDLAAGQVNGTWQGSSGPCTFVNPSTGGPAWTTIPPGTWGNIKTLRVSALARELTSAKGTLTYKQYPVTLTASVPCVY